MYRLGELLEEMPKANGGESGGRTKIDGSREKPSNPTKTLSDIGISKKLSMQCQPLAVILSLSSCGVNYHIRPKGACPTEGVSPLASNCPTADEMKQSKAPAK